MTKDQLKALVGQAALAYMQPGTVVGVGTGSTVNHFIQALGTMKERIAGAVSSSEESSRRLRALGIEVLDSNQVERIAVYIDGADEIDGQGFMIKGGGGALTREKVVADLADTFVCIADESKRVNVLGGYPLPVEVIPMAAAQVTRHLQTLGARVAPRERFVSDNGCPILDAHGLSIRDPLAMECEMNQWPGVVTVGIFARHRANVCLLGTSQGYRRCSFRPAGSGQNARNLRGADHPGCKPTEGWLVAKPNYSFEKRQRELAKKKKKEEKLKEKAERKTGSGVGDDGAHDAGEAADGAAEGAAAGAPSGR